MYYPSESPFLSSAKWEENRTYVGLNPDSRNRAARAEAPFPSFLPCTGPVLASLTGGCSPHEALTRRADAGNVPCGGDNGPAPRALDPPAPLQAPLERTTNPDLRAAGGASAANGLTFAACDLPEGAEWQNLHYLDLTHTETYS